MGSVKKQQCHKTSFTTFSPKTKSPNVGLLRNRSAKKALLRNTFAVCTDVQQL